MVEVEIVSGAVINAVEYTITYQLLLDGTPIATITREDNSAQSIAIARTIIEIPNMTWVDTPGAGAHTYSIAIAVNGTNITDAQVNIRALNVIQFT